MAFPIGIIGDYNTGKSYSRKSIVKGEECFVISPSAKATHLFTSEGKPVKMLNLGTEKNPTTRDLIEAINKAVPALGLKDLAGVVRFHAAKPIKDVTITGNHCVATLHTVAMYLKFIDTNMPHIKNIFIGDFTHFLSAILADPSFIERKAGGEAYQRFWELAGQALRDLILVIGSLREDLVVITEYHTAFDEKTGVDKIFVPGGQMLNEKFKLESYYDYMLCTKVNLNDDGSVKDYQFVTERLAHYNARFSNIFDGAVIPNDMELVLNKFREYNGI